METTPYDMNQLGSNLHLPPRKRLLAGFKKLNSNSNISSSSSSTTSAFASSSSSASNSNGSSSSSSSNVHTRQSPEELVEAARSAAALAFKTAKEARAMANEKALISSKAIAAAKRALELVDSFPKEAVIDCKERSQSIDHLSSNGHLRDEAEDLARRLNRVIDRRYSKVLGTREENGQINKKQKMNNTLVEGGSRVNGYMNDSDISYDGLESNRKVSKTFKPAEVDSIPTPRKEKAEEQSNSLGRKRGRVKLKKLPLSICNSRDHENRMSSVAQPLEDGVIPAVPGSSSRKCQDLKAPECAKQNKAVRS